MKAVDTPTNTHPKAPVHLLPPNFEQQIRDIDAAIHGDVPGLISEPGKEMMLTGEENTQPHTESRRVKEEWAKASGPNKGNQSQATIIGPQGPQLMTPGIELGLNHNGPKFMLGPASPKEIKIKTLKKPKGGDQKKNKENRGPTGKEMATGWTRKYTQRADKSSDTNMEVDLAEVGSKRRARPPLIELENMEGNGKRIRTEGEVKELGKLLAQHLGSAEAGSQPRWAQ